MWVDKYKPTGMKNIIGQTGDKSNAKKLLNWLNNWHKNRASGVKPSGKKCLCIIREMLFKFRIFNFGVF